MPGLSHFVKEVPGKLLITLPVFLFALALVGIFKYLSSLFCLFMKWNSLISVLLTDTLVCTGLQRYDFTFCLQLTMLFVLSEQAMSEPVSSR